MFSPTKALETPFFWLGTILHLPLVHLSIPKILHFPNSSLLYGEQIYATENYNGGSEPFLKAWTSEPALIKLVNPTPHPAAS